MMKSANEQDLVRKTAGLADLSFDILAGTTKPQPRDITEEEEDHGYARE